MGVVVLTKGGGLGEKAIPDFLREHSFFKTLSLYHAMKAGIPVLRTALLVERNAPAMSSLVKTLGLPLMVRMDYASLPRRKPLGGIPLHSMSAIVGVAEFLWSHQLYPLLQDHVDRLSDIYSAGASFESDTDAVVIELVGPGFDASDLRLGSYVPLEFLSVDLRNGRVVERRTIDAEAYREERRRRILKIGQLRAYTRFVNKHHSLSPSLEAYAGGMERSGEDAVPLEYSPLSVNDLANLVVHLRKLREGVLGEMPRSIRSVASLSLVRNRGWVFWDLYGSWYRR